MDFESEISLSDLNKLPLEERAQVVLRNYFYQSVRIKGEASPISFDSYLEAWAYLEKNNHVRLATEKEKKDSKLISMNIPYKITEEGNEFMDKGI